MTTLPCTKCLRELPLKAFNASKIAVTRGGIAYWCRDCQRAQHRKAHQHLFDAKAARKGTT